MATSTLMSVEEYLRTSFSDADREYVDGRIVERNVGEIDHSHLQTQIAFYIQSKYKNNVDGRRGTNASSSHTVSCSRYYDRGGLQA
jgi:Uma2 family endonuclease